MKEFFKEFRNFATNLDWFYISLALVICNSFLIAIIVGIYLNLYE